MYHADATAADLDAAYPHTLLWFHCSSREDKRGFPWTWLLWLTSQLCCRRTWEGVRSRECHHHGDTETNKNTLNYHYLHSERMCLLRIQSLWPLNMYSSKSQGTGFSLALCVFHFVLFILLFYFLINRNLGYNQDPSAHFWPPGVNMCL